jgi:hypothetical protein
MERLVNHPLSGEAGTPILAVEKLVNNPLCGEAG